MQINYDKNAFFDYKTGQKVWLKIKYSKTGEQKKCAPRHDAPWKVMEKLCNSVNFSIKNDKTNKSKVVHHDRLKPAYLESNPHQGGVVQPLDVQLFLSIRKFENFYTF